MRAPSGVLALLALAAVPTWSAPHGSAEAAVTAVFNTIARMQAQQVNKTAREISALDRQCQSLAPEALRWGWRSVAPLSRVLAQRSLPVKTRLFAASFLGLTRDPLAFPPLKALLHDPAEPALLRSAAAESLPDLGVSKAALRAALCPVLDEEALPKDVLTLTLIGLAHIGCEDPALLEKTARAFGPRPSDEDGVNARRALTALSHSLPPSVGRSLLSLLAYYPPASPLREAALQALWAKRADLLFFRVPAGEAVLAALKADTNTPAVASAAIPLLAALRYDNAAPLLLRLLDNPDPEVLTLAAEALSALRALEARPRLEAILAQAHQDERFAPQPGKPSPQALLARIESAARLLR